MFIKLGTAGVANTDFIELITKSAGPGYDVRFNSGTVLTVAGAGAVKALERWFIEAATDYERIENEEKARPIAVAVSEQKSYNRGGRGCRGYNHTLYLLGGK